MHTMTIATKIIVIAHDYNNDNDNYYKFSMCVEIKL